MNDNRVLPVIGGLALLVLCWEGAIALFAIEPFVLPRVFDILARLLRDWPALAQGLMVTGAEALTGFVLGTLIGIATAVLMYLFPPFERGFLPVAVAVDAVPVVAFAPLALLWFGMGPASKITIVTLTVSFIVLLNTLHGLRQPDAAAVNLLRSFGASRPAILYRLLLPAAMPSVVTGMRLGIARCMIVALLGEMLGAYRGLGWMIFEATQQMDYLRLWACVLFASGASLLLYAVHVWIDRKLVWWH
ncbi:ABC transporter permease [Verticiella sediminum]|nr:ABC transporter permease [Verticiella sediminum]